MHNIFLFMFTKTTIDHLFLPISSGYTSFSYNDVPTIFHTTQTLHHCGTDSDNLAFKHLIMIILLSIHLMIQHHLTHNMVYSEELQEYLKYLII